ncbi:MAG: ECF transporter S component [Clostridia bacterium]|nr:ECF transporter S component [Clostridia bacterium]
MSNRTLTTRKGSQSNLFVFVSVAMLSAVAFVLMLWEFVLLPSNYLKMDFSDIPAIIGGIFFGPIYSVVIELIKNILELVVKGMGTQMGFGNLMNFVVGCAFAVPYSAVIRGLYKKNKTSGTMAWGIVLASVISTGITVVVGYFANLGIAPLFFKYFLETEIGWEGAKNAALVATMFNPIKCAILVAIMALFVTLALPRIRKAIKI